MTKTLDMHRGEGGKGESKVGMKVGADLKPGHNKKRRSSRGM